MFKKAKLYSLLAIIVASTVVGMFALDNTASAATGVTYSSACDEGLEGCKITLSSDSKIHKEYGDDTSTMDLEFVNMNSKNKEFMGIPKTALVFVDITPSKVFESAANTDGWSNGMYVIYFETADDFNNRKNAKFFRTYVGEWLPGTDQAKPNTYKTIGDIVTITEDSAPEVVDETETESQETVHEGTLEETEGNTVPSSCQIKGIGWLICPLFLFLAEVTDTAYEALDNTFLKLEPIALPGSEAGEDRLRLHDSWKVMRDISNIVFIVGFLVIVFSQVTSFGVGNYGIKRLLPKIIIAAILVNLSYYLCAVAVDISNILGNSLRGLLMPEGQTALEFNFKYNNGSVTEQVTETGFSGAAGWILGGAIAAGLVYVFLPVFLPLVFSAAVSILTVIIALTIRQALVVILIVISPLAFVALLLPNTESLFQKWRSLFTTMLLIYPIISVIFGASALASAILMDTDDFPTQMIGAAVAVVPLALTPIIMKVSGGLLNRWVGVVNDVDKGLVDKGRQSVERQGERLDNRRKITSLRGGGNRWAGGRYRRAAKGDAIDAGLKAEASRESNQFVAREIQNPDGEFARQVAGVSTRTADEDLSMDDRAAMDRATSSAAITVKNANLEEVKAAHATISSIATADGLVEELKKSGNSAAKTAALLERLVREGSTEQVATAVDTYGNSGQSVITQALAEALQKDGPQWIKASDIGRISHGGMTESFEEMTRNNLAEGALSPAKMANESKDNLNYANNIAAKDGNEPARQKMQDSAREVLSNPTLSGNVKQNGGEIARSAGMPPPVATTGTTTGTRPLAGTDMDRDEV